jgi:hypothetical protein
VEGAAPRVRVFDRRHVPKKTAAVRERYRTAVRSSNIFRFSADSERHEIHNRSRKVWRRIGKNLKARLTSLQMTQGYIEVPDGNRMVVELLEENGDETISGFADGAST